MRNHAEAIELRGRNYVRFEVFSHVDTAQKIAAELRKNGESLAHVVKSRGCNAVYVHRF